MSELLSGVLSPTSTYCRSEMPFFGSFLRSRKVCIRLEICKCMMGSNMRMLIAKGGVQLYFGTSFDVLVADSFFDK